MPWSLTPACIFSTLDNTFLLPLMPLEYHVPRIMLHTRSYTPSSPTLAIMFPETAIKILQMLFYALTTLWTGKERTVYLLDCTIQLIPQPPASSAIRRNKAKSAGTSLSHHKTEELFVPMVSVRTLLLMSRVPMP